MYRPILKELLPLNNNYFGLKVYQDVRQEAVDNLLHLFQKYFELVFRYYQIHEIY